MLSTAVMGGFASVNPWRSRKRSTSWYDGDLGQNAKGVNGALVGVTQPGQIGKASCVGIVFLLLPVLICSSPSPGDSLWHTTLVLSWFRAPHPASHSKKPRNRHMTQVGPGGHISLKLSLEFSLISVQETIAYSHVATTWRKPVYKSKKWNHSHIGRWGRSPGSREGSDKRCVIRSGSALALLHGGPLCQYIPPFFFCEIGWASKLDRLEF